MEPSKTSRNPYFSTEAHGWSRIVRHPSLVEAGAPGSPSFLWRQWHHPENWCDKMGIKWEWHHEIIGIFWFFFPFYKFSFWTTEPLDRFFKLWLVEGSIQNYPINYPKLAFCQGSEFCSMIYPHQCHVTAIKTPKKQKNISLVWKVFEVSAWHPKSCSILNRNLL